MRFLLLFLLSGCCNGPFVYVDCVGDNVSIQLLDEAGEPVDAQSIRWSGAGSGLGSCEGEDQDCSLWFLPGVEEGELQVTVVVDGVEHSQNFSLERPAAKAGECCGDVINEDLTFTLPS